MQNPKPDRPWPGVSKLLVERLEETFPDRCPALSMSDREIWMAAGAAAVVRKLRHELDIQHTTVLTKS